MTAPIPTAAKRAEATIRVHRFDSGTRLQTKSIGYMKPKAGGLNGLPTMLLIHVLFAFCAS